MSEADLSVVIPAYNERRRVQSCLGEVRAWLKDVPQVREVLIVVEQSSDGTLALAQQACAGESRMRVIDNQVHRGKGYAVRSGMLESQGRYTVFMDLDLSVPLEWVLRFREVLQTDESIDVLIGDRRHPQSAIVRRQSLLRQTMGRVFNFFVQLMVYRGIKDTQCGFKMFRAPWTQELFSRLETEGFSFDVELLVWADSLGAKVRTHPVEWHNSPESKVRIVRDSARMLLELFWIPLRVRWFRKD
jgi:dolichyl-phosphate beta-glucosyltransferase